jgi:hypothetical protein
MRLVHEARATEGESICATLTYDPDHLPFGGSLRKRDFRLFMHRLRKLCARKYQVKVRFFGIGEYGGEGARPHYHVILFGWFPRDARPWSKSRSGNHEFVSKELSEAWGLGLVSFQKFTPGSAEYVTGYVTDKPHAISRGFRGRELASIVDPATGEVLGQVEPEFCLMSRRPGIGATWLDRYGDQVRNDDFVMGAPGMKGRVPEYYDRRLAAVDGGEVAERKEQRLLRARSPKAIEEATEERLAVREVVAIAQRDQRRRHG